MSFEGVMLSLYRQIGVSGVWDQVCTRGYSGTFATGQVLRVPIAASAILVNDIVMNGDVPHRRRAAAELATGLKVSVVTPLKMPSAGDMNMADPEYVQRLGSRGPETITDITVVTIS